MAWAAVVAPWASPPALVDWGDDPRTGKIDLTRHELEQATVNDATVRLTADWNGEAGGDVVDARRRCWLRVAFQQLDLDDVLDQWVRPMQDLLIVLLGRPLRLTDLSVVPDTTGDAKDDESDDPEREKPVRVLFGGLMAAPGGEASWASLRSWGAPTMFLREDLPASFADLVAGWFAVRENLGEAIALLCSPFYAPFIHAEHRYAATFQSAESIARAKDAGAE